MQFREFLLSFLISGQLSVFQDLIIAESEQDSHALAYLLSVWLVKDIGKHIVVLDGEWSSLETV